MFPSLLSDHSGECISGGRVGILPGALTASLVCSILQLGYNELRVWRVHYVSRQHGEAALDSKPSTPSRPLRERLLLLLGIHRMSTEEYLMKLKKQREEALRRIAELEAEEAASATEQPEGSHLEAVHLSRPA